MNTFQSSRARTHRRYHHHHQYHHHHRSVCLRSSSQRRQQQQVWVKTENAHVAESSRKYGVNRLVLDEAGVRGASDAEPTPSGSSLPCVMLSEAGELREERVLIGTWYWCENVHGVLDVIERAAGDGDGEERARGTVCDEMSRMMVLDCVGDEMWTIIPAENIIAAVQRRRRRAGRNLEVFATARTAEEAVVLLGALEVGVDGVVLETNEADEVKRVMGWIEQKSRGKEEEDMRDRSDGVVTLSEARITKVEPISNLGDRVCVDVIETLAVGDALQVGSFAQGLFLVHSECLESMYIASRPFRFNAGAIHSYVLTPGDKTAYLSELRSGDAVLVTNTITGVERSVTIGRLKIERRPMIRIEAEANAAADGDDDGRYSVILQHAETVRLLVPGSGIGASVPVTDLQVGASVVLLRLLRGARHTGILVNESVFIEK